MFTLSHLSLNEMVGKMIKNCLLGEKSMKRNAVLLRRCADKQVLFTSSYNRKKDPVFDIPKQTIAAIHHAPSVASSFCSGPE
jgi:hypothetical protein